jgi:hypothetical protein
LAYEIQTPAYHPKERIQHSEYGESLKSRQKIVIENGSCIYTGVDRVCEQKFAYDYSRACKCEAGLRI